MTLKSRLTAVLAMAAVVGIGLATPTLATSTASSASTPSCGIYWGSQPKPGSVAPSSAIVQDVRTGQHTCYDRLVIDVQGGPVGRWTASYAESEPNCYKCWYARGGANLNVVLGNPAVPSPDGLHSTAVDDWYEAIDVTDYRTFRHVREVDFGPDGVFYALGVRAHLPFRIFTLDGPGPDSRLVIDVAHKW